MSPQIVCLRRCKGTLIAFVRLFSTVCFQMCPQSACIRGCKITLVAFVWLFSTVRFQMSPQIVYPRREIVTLVAFVWFNDIASFFLQDFRIWFFWTKVIIGHFFIHYQCVLCCAQMVASNWTKFIIDFWSPCVKFSTAYFHFLGLINHPRIMPDPS